MCGQSLTIISFNYNPAFWIRLLAALINVKVLLSEILHAVWNEETKYS